MGATLQALEERWVAADAEGWRATDRAVTSVVAGPDVAEGLAAFAAKREPVWSSPPTPRLGSDLV